MTNNSPNKTRKRVIVAFIIAEVILLCMFCASYYLSLKVTSTRVIFIPKGGTFSIISHLDKSGYDVTVLDPFFLFLFGQPQHGWIDLKTTECSKGDFLYKIVTAKAALKELTLIPGETLYFFFKQIASDFSLSEKKLYEEYFKYTQYSDGVIVPDTYFVPVGIDEKRLIKYLMINSLETHKKLSIKFLGIYDEVQWFKYITIASIIQKEAANNEEMPLISSVIYNRLKLNMPLQMDGTLNYGQYSHTKVTPQRIDSDNSAYNTYKNKGLPPHPVGSVSIEAIKAAIFPAKTEYLYFVKNKNGTHTFSKHYNEHLENIKR